MRMYQEISSRDSVYREHVYKAITAWFYSVQIMVMRMGLDNCNGLVRVSALPSLHVRLSPCISICP